LGVLIKQINKKQKETPQKFCQCCFANTIPYQKFLRDLDEIYSTNGVADLGSGAFLTLGSGMGEKSGSGFGMNNQDHISESLETIF
jgi:hypothetical protein